MRSPLTLLLILTTWLRADTSRLMVALALLLAASVAPPAAHADTLNFNCRGWMPIYLGSWVPINPDPSDFDMLRVEVNEQTKMTSFVLTMIGRASFATKISESHVKGAIPFKALMVDDMVEYIDFMLNRGTGEIIITALEKAYRRPHTLFKGKCIEVKSPFSKSKSNF
ncbi:MAG: hypothetical protein RL404_816 [Pseudomonadota bacterium]